VSRSGWGGGGKREGGREREEGIQALLPHAEGLQVSDTHFLMQSTGLVSIAEVSDTRFLMQSTGLVSIAEVEACR
jgi:hypothetical protein